MKAGTQLAIRRMCALTGVSRAGFYRRGVRSRSAPVELRDQVQHVALEWPAYGSRRITAELRRCGLPVNRKRVQRVMREDNLLCLRQHKFVATTPLRPRVESVSEPRGRAGGERCQPALAGRYHLHPVAGRVHLLRGVLHAFAGGRSAGRWIARWKPS